MGAFFYPIFLDIEEEGARSLIKLGSDTSVIPQNDQFDVQGIKGKWVSHVFFSTTFSETGCAPQIKI